MRWVCAQRDAWQAELHEKRRVTCLGFGCLRINRSCATEPHAACALRGGALLSLRARQQQPGLGSPCMVDCQRSCAAHRGYPLAAAMHACGSWRSTGHAACVVYLYRLLHTSSRPSWLDLLRGSFAGAPPVIWYDIWRSKMPMKMTSRVLLPMYTDHQSVTAETLDCRKIFYHEPHWSLPREHQ